MVVNSTKQIARVFGVECWREDRAKQNLPRELRVTGDKRGRICRHSHYRAMAAHLGDNPVILNYVRQRVLTVPRTYC